jgi:oligopeptide/dipeptide ABC transporter ATP-binding protein
MATLLHVDDLQVDFVLPRRTRVHALCGIHLKVEAGICYGVLGESGSGKSTLARALMRLLPQNADVMSGSVEFNGRDLFELTDRELQKYHGAGVAFIPQEPGLALNPVMKIGDQIAEVIRAHTPHSASRIRSEAESLLERVHLSSAARRIYDAYPHQLSGGQQQRVLIAQALSCNPSLVIADEPTSSLDAETESEILQLLFELKSTQRMALLLITHDPRILHGLADRIAVLYAGRVVEDAPADVFFRDPQHPYSKSLLACATAPLDGTWKVGEMRLPTIQGSSPDPERPRVGCEFAPRCDKRMPQCESQQPLPVSVPPDRRIECHLYDQ